MDPHTGRERERREEEGEREREKKGSHVNQRFADSDHLILPISSLRVPDFFDLGVTCSKLFIFS